MIPPIVAIHRIDEFYQILRQPETLLSKMMFHPRPERPTKPAAGFVRYEPGAYHPLHRHDFAQIWYILEGTFTIGGKTYDPAQ
jgi:quercetin dioxygenase-like cupin family protein